MKNNRPSIDGFIPRRPGSQIGDLHSVRNADAMVTPIDRSLHTGDNVAAEEVGKPREGKVIGRSDIDESLREIDSNEPTKKSRKARRAAKKAKRPRNKVLRTIKWILISLLIIAIAIAGYVFIKAALAGTSVFKGSIFDFVQSEPLKEDANGRTNFVIFGTAEDDEGGNHGGPNLTDSIMVMSIDQDAKNAYMLSLPRDLWVQYEDSCTVGYQGKLNAQYFCGSNDGENEDAGATALEAKVGEITGLDIQYYVHLNFTAVSETVDAVGGVDVTIQSEDPRGIYDPNFDWKCNYKCHYVDYTNGQQVHLDGAHALALARARNAQGGYGLPNGNFDREKNQQKIVKALREKAVSAGTLTNVGAITGLIDALGKNLRTNIQTKEVRTLMDFGSKLKNEDIISLSLVEEGKMLVTTGSYNGQSIVRPIAGLLDYSAIKAYVQKQVSNDPVAKETPHVTVLNGSGTAGVAQTEADKLESKGFTIDSVSNAPDGSYGKATIYQINAKKTASATKLKEIYGVTLVTTPPPFSVVGETDFVVVIGQATQ
ncbi:MAG: LCP family protein [Candidatus Saccharimonadales bacterium]